VAAIILIGAYALLRSDGGGDGPLGGDFGGRDGKDIPDPYYLELKPADVQNPDDVIRYSSSIKGYAADLDVFERAAFYEWYFKSHGFDVSFAYAEDFVGKGNGNGHVWLLVRNKKGEVIEVDPSFSKVGGQSMVPLNTEYTVYDQEFENIYAASDVLDEDRMAWWKNKNACEVLNENVLVAEKDRAKRMAEG